MREHINGILLTDKQHGLTSNAMLQKVKRLFNAFKAGHTGSLDPIATGMLPICFGEATKFSQYLLDSNKSYFVTAKLGARTTTGDVEGSIIENKPVPSSLTLSDIKLMAQTFLGTQEQMPPMFSALKVNGRPLYELARRGVEIERATRTITIFSLNFHELINGELTFDVSCSKGTYIRTLVEDLGSKLGCGAHVIALRRTSVASYQGHAMLTFNQLEHIVATEGGDGLKKCLLPIDTALQDFPVVALCRATSFYIRMGQPVCISRSLTAPFVRLMSDTNHFLGLGEVMPDGRIKPHRLLSSVSHSE